MNTPLETLLSRLAGVKQVRSNGWMSRCPAHNGDGRSLAITDKDNGYILIHCFAHECEVSDILAAVGMSVGYLFPERLPDRSYSPPKHAIPGADLVRALKFELTKVQLIVSDIANGTADVRVINDAAVTAGRLRKALDLCDG